MCRSSPPEWSIILAGGNRREREKTRHRVKDGGLGAVVICLANLRNLFVNTSPTGAATLNSARVCSAMLRWRFERCPCAHCPKFQLASRGYVDLWTVFYNFAGFMN